MLALYVLRLVDATVPGSVHYDVVFAMTTVRLFDVDEMYGNQCQGISDADVLKRELMLWTSRRK